MFDPTGHQPVPLRGKTWHRPTLHEYFTPRGHVLTAMIRLRERVDADRFWPVGPAAPFDPDWHKLWIKLYGKNQ